MHSRYDFKQIKNDMTNFEKKFAVIKDSDLSNAACIHASMKDYFETLAKTCEANFKIYMDNAVKVIQER